MTTRIDWSLVFWGGFVSLPINVIFTYDMPFDYIRSLIILAALVVSLWFLRGTYKHSKIGRIRKIRLIFLGVSLFSFLFAFQDMIVFITGVHGFMLSEELPYFWLGSVPVPSLLGSFLIGGLFNVAERLMDVMGKQAC